MAVTRAVRPSGLIAGLSHVPTGISRPTGLRRVSIGDDAVAEEKDDDSHRNPRCGPVVAGSDSLPDGKSTRRDALNVVSPRAAGR